MIHKCVTTHLDYKGKYVRLSTRNGVKLLASDKQNGAITGNVEIWKRDNNDFALCFKNEKKTYVLNVREDDLVLVQTTNVKAHIQNGNNLWFRKYNVRGEDYCIHTASTSPKYLTVKEEKINNIPNWFIGLSETPSEDGIFTAAPGRCLEGRCAAM